MNREIRNEQSSGIMVYREVNGGKREYLFLVKRDGPLDFPKGHIEEGEDEVSAAVRETEEESGLQIMPFDGFRHEMEYWISNRNGKIRKKVIMFVGKVAEGQEPTISHEHVALVWLRYEDAIKALNYENQRKMLEKVELFLSSLQQTAD